MIEAGSATERALGELKDKGKFTSPDLKRLFNQGKSLTSDEKEVRNELFLIVFDLCHRSWAELKRKTGMHKTTAQRLLKAHRAAIEADPDGPAQELSHHTKLEEIRFQGRAQLIDLMFEGAVRYAEKVVNAVGDKMTAVAAAKIAAIFTDKGLLLSGQPTSRVSRTDEKMLTDDELEERLKKYAERKFSLVEGGRGEANSA